jgi:hypothetical protein
MKQFPEHIAVRTGKQNAALLRECGYEDINIEPLAHYNVLKHLHPLRRLPLIGTMLEARLWITATR